MRAASGALALGRFVTVALGRLRHGREATAVGYRHGHRARTLLGTFGRVELDVPRARIAQDGGGMRGDAPSGRGHPAPQSLLLPPLQSIDVGEVDAANIFVPLVQELAEGR